MEKSQIQVPIQLIDNHFHDLNHLLILALQEQYHGRQCNIWAAGAGKEWDMYCSVHPGLSGSLGG